MNIIPVFAAAASIVLAAGCHHRHHDRDYYRSGPPRHDHYHHDRDGWEEGPCGENASTGVPFIPLFGMDSVPVPSRRDRWRGTLGRVR